MLTDLKKALSDSQDKTKDNGWYPIFFENHDQPRSINHFFPDDADPDLAGKALGCVLLTLRGTPFLYQGEELGFTNVNWDSIDDYDDLRSVAEYEAALAVGLTEEEALDCVHRFSRDNARTPMQWNTTYQAGFTDGTPWLPVHDDYKEQNAAVEEEASDSVLNWYHTLVTFREENPVLIDGSYEEKLDNDEQIYAYLREDDSDSLLVMVNFSGEAAYYDPKAAGLMTDGEQILLNNYGDTETVIGMLRPYEAVIIR